MCGNLLPALSTRWMKANLKQQSGEDWKDVQTVFVYRQPQRIRYPAQSLTLVHPLWKPTWVRSGFQPGNLVEGDGPWLPE